jgi:hypothetical protein
MIKKIREILKGIDKDISQNPRGWWETSTGAEFGAKKLKQIEDLVKKITLPDAAKGLLSDENIKKMANEYTGGEEDYKAFILACNVIAEKIIKLC